MASQTGLKEVVSLYQTLIKEWNRKPVDLEKVGKLLSGMKVSCNVSFSWNTLLLNCFSDLRMISPFTRMHRILSRELILTSSSITTEVSQIYVVH